MEKKTVSQKILDKVTNRSLAYWFMDDGSVNSDGSGFSIATCSFSEQENELIVDFLYNRFGVRAKTRKYKYSRIHIFAKEAVHFKDIIEQYVTDSMKYKLALSVGCGSLKEYKKLSVDEYAEIKSLYYGGNFSMKEIGVKFGVTQSSISRIVNGRK